MSCTLGHWRPGQLELIYPSGLAVRHGLGAKDRLDDRSTRFTRVGKMSTITRIATLTDAYLAGLDPLRRAVMGLPPAQLRARPIADRWTTLEVLAHLADMEG